MGSAGDSLANGVPKAVEGDGLVMPIINFNLFLNGSPSERQEIASQVSNAFTSSGFLYLANHGIPATTIQNAFRRSATFFARPQSQKDQLQWTTPESNRGYVAHGREKVTQATDASEIAALRTSNPDLKESMEIGKEGVAGLPNQWPDHLDQEGAEFTTDMKAFFLTIMNLHVEVMRAIGLGMGLAPDFFDTYTDAGDNNLRLLHYPSVENKVFRENPNQVRAGEHSDYGSITLLFQDDVGGLEVKSPRGTWVRATPIKDTIVVNAGDLLSRWSNGMIQSTRHRVIQPPPKEGENREIDYEGICPERYSIAYFCNPNFHRYIDALPGTFEESGKKYEGINSGDYLVKRLGETY